MPDESERAYRAFECYLDMPYWERKDLYAYRNYTGNPEASHVSATWSSWKEEFFWEERVRAYDYHVQKERREQTIQAQVEVGYERGDELGRMEQRMFHVQELFYEKHREKLEEDNLLDWRPMDVINLSRVMTEAYSAIKKARSLEKSDRFEPAQPLTDEEMYEIFGIDNRPNRDNNEGQEEAGEDAGAPLPLDTDEEDRNGL
jgi:hypothetical protein